MKHALRLASAERTVLVAVVASSDPPPKGDANARTQPGPPHEGEVLAHLVDSQGICAFRRAGNVGGIRVFAADEGIEVIAKAIGT